MQKIDKSFSQDIEILSLLMFEPRLCTKHELETIYSTEDLYDFLEMIEAKQAIEEEQIKEAEKG